MLSSLVHACKRCCGLREGIDGVDLGPEPSRIDQPSQLRELVRGLLDDEVESRHVRSVRLRRLLCDRDDSPSRAHDHVGNEERLLQALSASERRTLDALLRKLLTGLESG